MLGVINVVTNYFQALGKALSSLIITLMRNAILFIPAVIIQNYVWNLNGVFVTQPVVETILSIVCVIMYVKEVKNEKSLTYLLNVNEILLY